MQDKIYIYPYFLKSTSRLNAKSERKTHRGVLIRIGKNAHGYGCVHPWPELGDLDLDETLKLLARGEFTLLTERTFQYAWEDQKARAQNRSLFYNLKVPRNYASVLMDQKQVSAAVQAGFDTVKLKMGKDLKSEISFLNEQARQFPKLKWRLDFNQSHKASKLAKFVSRLDENMKENIDYLEDAWTASEDYRQVITQLDLPLAIDRYTQKQTHNVDYMILKPALCNYKKIIDNSYRKNNKYIFTSYMDHPVGQCFAAWQAALAWKEFPEYIGTCGLVTHGLFEENDFSKLLGQPRPEFRIPSGTGIGFNDLLGSLPWIPLNKYF